MPALLSPTFARRFDAALLFADLSGFTALTDRFAAQGPAGAEALARLLNLCFGRLADEILAAGGDVLHFAGDAPIALFPETPAPGALARASACALRLQAAMPELSIAAGQALSLRIAVTRGEFAALSVGAHGDRREFVVAGPAFAAIAPTLAVAQPGETWLATAGGRELVTGTLGDPAPSPPVPPPAAPDTTMVRPFLSRSLVARLDAGQSEWIAEWRRVTTLFVTINGLADISPAGLARLDEIFSVMQGAVYAADGSVNQFLVDDKGTTLVAAWGVPGRSHDNDATRAALAAMDIAAALTTRQVDAGIGLATGRVFCGWRGNYARREFALIGRSVNLASRLAGQPGAIRADVATRDAASTRVRWTAGPAASIKGLASPVETFAPSLAAGGDASPARSGSGMVGRAAERDLLAHAIAEVVGGRGGAVLIEGEAGTGKSTLLADVIRDVDRGALRVLSTAAAPMVRTGALDVWRDLLRQLLDLHADGTLADHVAQLHAAVADVAALRESAPLLANVLGVPMPDNDFTAGLKGGLRGEATREAVVGVVRRAAHQRPLLIVVDDAQWLDSLSWSALAATIAREPRLLAFVGHRPMMEPPAEWPQILQHDRTRIVRLDRLSDDEVEELTRRELASTAVPGGLRSLILAKTQGHPLFVTELVRWLRDTGAIIVDERGCRLAARVEDLSAELPGTVEGVLLGRFDQLPAEHHLTLRVASVLGQTFSVDAMAAVHPVDRDRISLATQLAACERQRFLTAGSDGAFAFAHALVHDVAYGLVVPTQRVSWHRATASYLESTVGDAGADAVLAFHWTRAEDYGRAIGYLERAGTSAVARGAGVEPRTFFRQAVNLADQHGIAVAPLKRARWQRMISQACSRTGDAKGASSALVEAFAVLKYPFVDAPGPLRRRLIRELVQQVRHLVLPPRPADGERAAYLRELMWVFRAAADRAYFDANHLGIATWAFAMVNAAEEAGLQDEVANGYSAAAYMAAMVGVRPLAERWWRLGAKTSDAEQRLAVLLSQGLTFLGECRWDRLTAVLDAHEAIARRTSLFQLDNNFVLRIIMEFQCGRLTRSIAYAEALLESALAQQNDQHEIWARQSLESLVTLVGRHDEAEAHWARLEELAPSINDLLTTVQMRGNRIERLMRAGDFDGAFALLPELERNLHATPPTSTGSLVPFNVLARASLAAWSRAVVRGDADAAARGAAARRNLTPLRKYARMFPYGRAYHALLEGAWHWTAGHHRRAARAWEKSRRIAVAQQMPVAEVQAEQLLALATRGRPAHARHAGRVDALTRQLGFEQHLVEFDVWQSSATTRRT
ncbi:MAG TPA: AAA family ATPase [Vicinamibacterales bacterium]|nr:AAA family ATPase [Vicinamibacterales bacterium]